MSSESKLAFFRQSGWLVISTGVCGVFLMAVYSVVQKMPELGTFLSMLRFFTVLGIFTAGLQVVMAQEAAAAVTPESNVDLAHTASSIARGIVLFWLGIVLLCFLSREWLLETLKISKAATLAVTLALVLAQLLLPFVQGLLQGQQKFGALGWSIMLNGVGRFLAILALTWWLRADAATALAGVFVGLGAAVVVAAWSSRSLIFARQRRAFPWALWLKRAIPLSAGAGSILFLMNADVLFVQAHFSAKQTQYYSAVAIVGIGLVTVTTPMAAVMFPKLVRSVAQAQKSDSLTIALIGTAILGVGGAVFCTLWPSLPLRIMYFRNPDLWQSAQLVPWFMWSMLPVTVANVLVGSLLARRDFRAVPWLVVIALCYGLEMNRYLNAASALELFANFKGVILRLGIFSTVMLLVAAAFARRPVR